MTTENLSPADPNQDRTLTIRYTTDEAGEMTIDVDETCFNGDKNLIISYLAVTLETLLDAEGD